MQPILDQLGFAGEVLLTVLGALLIFIIGYIVARILASLVRRLLHRTDLDNRLVKAVGGDGLGFSVEDASGKVVFWLVILFVLVAIFNFLSLPGIAAPIQGFLTNVTNEWLPRLGAAALLLLIAWIVATIVKLLVIKAGKWLKIDERLSKNAQLETGEQVSIIESLALAAYWLIFLIFLPDVLRALGMTSLSDPIQDMIGAGFNYLPDVISAAVLLAIGWIVARIVRQIVVGLLAAIGIDKWGEGVGLKDDRSLSKLIGTILYTLIMILVIIAALDALNIAAISEPTISMLTTLMNAVPSILGAAIVLLIAYFVGRLVSRLIADLLKGLGVDGLPEKLGLQWTGSRSLSDLIGYLILVGIMLLATLSAVELLGSTFVSGIVFEVVTFAGHVLLALVIIGIGLYVANLVRDIVLSTGGERASIWASLARYAILLFALAMGLRQLNVANDIVNLAFGILLGAMGIAAALAFGLGGRETAGKEVARMVAAMRKEDVEDQVE